MASDLQETRFWNIRPILQVYQRLINNDKARDQAVHNWPEQLGFIKGWQRNIKEELQDVVRMPPK